MIMKKGVVLLERFVSQSFIVKCSYVPPRALNKLNDFSFERFRSVMKSESDPDPKKCV